MISRQGCLSMRTTGVPLLGGPKSSVGRNRELNPDIGLEEAKDVIDGLVGRVLSSGGEADPGAMPRS